MSNMTAVLQLDFLEQYILDILAANGLQALTTEQKQMYIPALSAKLQERIGLVMMPKLSPEKLTEFAALIDDPNTTSENWQQFWPSAIPNFEEEMKQVLVSFASDIKELLTA